MNAQNITFSANEQVLTKTDDLLDFASNTVSYIEATFTLGTNWTGFDSVRAVWKSDYHTIATVLDANHKCVVPSEILMYRSKVYVNLVGSIAENNVLTDRLTTFPVQALVVTQNAEVGGSETAPITASQFEQFVDSVRDAAGSISDYSYDSEAWAVGTRGGVDVPSTDPTYHNNSKYWAEQNAGLSDEVADLSDDVADLKSDLQEITEEITFEGFDESDNLVDGLILSRDYYPNNQNAPYSNENFSYLGIDVTGITKLKINGTHHIYTVTQFSAMGVFLDADNNWLANVYDQAVDLSSFPIVVNVPNGATKLYLNTDYKASDYPSSLPSGLYVYPWRTNVEAIKVPYSALEKTPVALADLSDGDKKLKIIAGVIRNSGNGWEYINDTGHNPLNLTTVSVNSDGQIVIDYGFTATKVLSLVVCPDETFASRYTAGSSVGLDNSIINVCTMPVVYGGLVTLSNNTFNIGYSSFTSGSFDTATGEIKLYHPSVASLLGREKFNISAECNNAVYRAIIGSQGNDYVSLYLVNSSGTVLKDTTGVSISMAVTRQINSNFINANDIVSAGGNFWIMGVMEV